MDCETVQANMVPYLYEDIDEAAKAELEEHVASCPDCRRSLEEFRHIQTLLFLASPSCTSVKTLKISQHLKIMSMAASILLAFFIGWWSNGLYHKTHEKPASQSTQIKLDHSSVRKAIRESLENREGFSIKHKENVRNLERILSQVEGCEEGVSIIHKAENLREQGKIYDAARLERTFLKRFPTSDFVNLVTLRLARSLYKDLKQPREASVLYNRLLESQGHSPEDKVELLWELSQVRKDEGNTDIACNIWKSLQDEKDFPPIALQAKLMLADEEFHQGQFFQALKHYQEYSELSPNSVSRVTERIGWLELHKEDDFYPLTLYQKAVNEGESAYYGLRIIMTRYPDSPLAFKALKLYLDSEARAGRISDSLAHFITISFEDQRKAEAAIEYLRNVSQIQGLPDVAAYAQYWIGRLTEEGLKRKNQAVIEYQRAINMASGDYLEDISRKRLNQLQKNSKADF